MKLNKVLLKSLYPSQLKGPLNKIYPKPLNTYSFQWLLTIVHLWKKFLKLLVQSSRKVLDFLKSSRK